MRLEAWSVALVLMACGGDTQPERPVGCEEMPEGGLPASTATGTLELGWFDYADATYHSWEDGDSTWLQSGEQDANFCMITPAICLRVDWLEGERECLLVTWNNELVSSGEQAEPSFHERPSLGEVFHLERDGRYCSRSVWNAL